MTSRWCYRDADELALRAAEFVAAEARDAVARRGAFHLALAGGSTPRLTYEALTRPRMLARSTIENIHIYWGDERSVPNTHLDSNVRMARESLIDPLGIPAGNIHAPNGDASDLEAEAERYEREMLEYLPKQKGTWPMFDLVMVGMGTDGHTASLFPGTEGLSSEDRFFIVNDVPTHHTRRLTLTFPAINAAAHVLILVSGEAKAPVIANIFGGAEAVYPIQKVTGGIRGVTWMADAAAASHMPARMRQKVFKSTYS